MKKRRYLIYLADLVHNYMAAGTHMFPLNVGFIASYAKKVFADEVQIELFKYPNHLMKRMGEDAPDLLGLSNYVWSSDLNRHMTAFAKSVRRDIVVVSGGPDISNSPYGYDKFLKASPHTDFYVVNEGELGFANVLRVMLNLGKPLSANRELPIDGVVSFGASGPVIGKRIPRMDNLDDIPSPYLTGLLDEFFGYELIPVVETNRGCPFLCTYCVQGLTSQNQVKHFGSDRVLRELDYISQRVRKTNILCLSDANFGIADRDVKIAEHIRKLQRDNGYPRRCIINWVKTKNSVRLAEIISDASLMISSLQSMDPQVLKNIKRNNISQSNFKDIVDSLNSKGAMSGTEIILALPGETKDSHLNSLRKLFEWDVGYIICYNLLLYEGSELNSPQQREKFNLRTGFRLIDTAFGLYDNGIVSFECEEGVRSTSTMSEEEVLFFRPIHWLIQFCWNYRFYFDLLKYVKRQGVNPVEFFLELVNNINSAPDSVSKIFSEFSKEAADEWFGTTEELREYYARPENLEALRSGTFGKMNGRYIWRVVLECKEDFDAYVMQTAKKLLPLHGPVIESLVRFSSESLLDFGDIKGWEDGRESVFDHDILRWRESKYEGCPERRESRYNFYLPQSQKDALSVLLHQYVHPNKNFTLRKISEHMRITDLFYKLDRVA